LNRLEGKIAFVTGGSGTIGEAIVNKMVGEGAIVIFSYNSREEVANRLAKKWTERNHAIEHIHLDVQNRQCAESVFSHIENTYGRLDILVNNAGINRPTDFDKINDDEWDEILKVNLRGPFIVCQEALELLRKSGEASIINISSVSGQFGGPRTAHYAASKAGLISLSQVIARFCAQDNIRCNTVAVGFVESEIAEKGLKSGMVADIVEQILLRRLGTKEEIADVVAYLASRESNYITAQTINVNGGLYF